MPATTINPKKLIGKKICVTGRFFENSNSPVDVKIAGTVMPNTDDEYLYLKTDDGSFEEYVWESGFYGASGDLDGIGTALSEGRAKLTVKRNSRKTTGVTCEGSGIRVPLSVAEERKREARCRHCDRWLRIRPVRVNGNPEATMPQHKKM